MNSKDTPESGYVGDMDVDLTNSTTLTDIEIIHVTSINVIARGRRYGRQWLLKGLRPELAGSTAHRRQMMKEFEIQSRLSHPALNRAVSMEDVEGLGLCMVIEWVEGQTLAEVMKTKTLNKRERRRLLRDIVVAVACLHRHGIVHRDLKPSNIMVRDFVNEVVIIDFGLADTTDYVELKQAAGTSGYISPEQLSSGGANPSDDVYSLGMIISELCPSDRSLSRKCLASRTKAPSDARALLRLIDARPRRLRTIALVCAIAVVLGVAAVIFQAFRSFNSITRRAENTISNLKSENRQGTEQLNLLKDSLDYINRRLSDSENKRLDTQRYLEAKETALKDGMAFIDGLANKYDRRIFPGLPQGDLQAYVNQVSKIGTEMNKTIDNYCASLPDSLSDIDKESIKLSLSQYYTIKMSAITQKWNERFYSGYNQ